MKYHDPWGTAAAAQPPKINIRSRGGFDWDSDQPVPGEVHKPDTGIMLKVLEYGIALDVVLLGWLAMDWWNNGGFYLMWDFMFRFAGDLMGMILRGFW